jgi:hypothetical protein
MEKASRVRMIKRSVLPLTPAPSPTRGEGRKIPAPRDIAVPFVISTLIFAIPYVAVFTFYEKHRYQLPYDGQLGGDLGHMHHRLRALRRDDDACHATAFAR